MGSIEQQTPSGKEMLKHFLFEPGYVNLNHGSFGTIPHQVRHQLRHYQDLGEASPDKYLRYTYPGLLDDARKAAAAIVNAPVDEVVFIHNASTGVNTVLRNLVYKPNDAIVWFDTAYGAVHKTIESILETNPGLKACRVDYTLPCSFQTIVDNFLEVVKDARAKGLNPKVAVFDTIVSVPGVRFPFELLTKACREEGILSCVDGAHGIGQVPLDLSKLDADFFVSNCHKWFYTPRACALFHVPSRNHHLIRTTYPTSHGYQPQTLSSSKTPHNPLDNPSGNAFTSLFQFVATDDNAPYYCFPSAQSFRTNICGGEERIYGYMKRLAAKGGDTVAGELGTEVMKSPAPEGGSEGLTDCAFANVRLPIRVADDTKDSSEGEVTLHSSEINPMGRWFEKVLMSEFNTFIPIYPYKGKVWVRLSAQIYLEEEDFKFAARVLREMCERVGKGEGKDEWGRKAEEDGGKDERAGEQGWNSRG